MSGRTLLLGLLLAAAGCGPGPERDGGADAAADSGAAPLALPPLPLDSASRIADALAGARVALAFDGPAVQPDAGLGVMGPDGTVHLVFTADAAALAATLFDGEDRVHLFSVWQLWSPDVELVRLWIGPGALPPGGGAAAPVPLTNPFLSIGGTVAMLTSAPPPGTPGVIALSASEALEIQSWEPPPPGGGAYGRLRASIPAGASLFVLDQPAYGILDPSTLRTGAVDGTIDVAVVDAADLVPAPRPLESGLALVAEVPIDWADADVWGGPGGSVAYVAANSTQSGDPTFHVVDLADPAAPVVATRYALGRGKDVQTEGDTLFVAVEPTADSSGAVRIFDVTDPLDPQPLATVNAPPLSGSGVHNLFVAGGVLYATAGAAGFEVYDVSAPAAPVRLSNIPVPPGVSAVAHDVAVVGTVAYLSTLYGGVEIADVTDPAAPVILGTVTYADSFAHNAWPSADGQYLFVTDEYVGGAVRVFDVSDPAAAVQVAALPMPRRNAIAHNVYVDAADRALVVYYLDGVRTYDVSDPTAPVETAFWENVRAVPSLITNIDQGVGAFGVWWGPDGAGGTRILASDTFRGLLVLQ